MMSDELNIPNNVADKKEQAEFHKHDRDDNSSRLQEQNASSESPFDFDSPRERKAMGQTMDLKARDKYLATEDDRSLQNEDWDTTSLVELVRERSNTERIQVGYFRFLQSGPHLSVVPEIKYEGRTFSVPKLTAVLSDSLLLPTGVADYGRTRELFGSVQALFTNHLGLADRQSALLSCWCITTWFPDYLDFIPRLIITGPVFAADHLLRLLRCACRRPVLLAGIDSSLYRAIPFEELNPTLLLRLTRLSKTTVSLLARSDQQGYLVACGKQIRNCYCAKCVYVEKYSPDADSGNSIHVHIPATRKPLRRPLVPSDADVQLLQDKLFRYRAFNHDLVGISDFNPIGLSAKLSAIARQLGAAIVEDEKLQDQVVELLKDQDDQSRVDHAMTTAGMVLRALLIHCHDDGQQQVFVRQLAATINHLYQQEGEPLKISNETVGYVLKDLGLYTRRLGNGGRGLVLDKATRFLAHELSYANEVLTDDVQSPCGYCHDTQMKQAEELV